MKDGTMYGVQKQGDSYSPERIYNHHVCTIFLILFLFCCERYTFMALFTLFILIDFPIHIDSRRMSLSILYFKGSKVAFLNYDGLMSIKVVLILVNSANPNKCSVILDFIRVSTVYQSTYLGVTSKQKVKDTLVILYVARRLISQWRCLLLCANSF